MTYKETQVNFVSILSLIMVSCLYTLCLPKLSEPCTKNDELYYIMKYTSTTLIKTHIDTYTPMCACTHTHTHTYTEITILEW